MKFLGVQGTLKSFTKLRNSWAYSMQVSLWSHALTVSWCKIPGHSIRKREMLILLAIPGHTYKRSPNKNITMQNNGRPGGTFVRYRCPKFYRSRAGHFGQFMMLLTIFPTIYINCTTFKIANLFFDVQRVQLKTLHYLLQAHLLNNAMTSLVHALTRNWQMLPWLS